MIEKEARTMGSSWSRRPSRAICGNCGKVMHLVRCGVDAHMAMRTRREQIEGRCPGRVYAHDETGGIEC